MTTRTITAASPASAPVVAAPPLHDPAARRRLVGALAALVIAWPVLQLSEFQPWQLLTSGNLAVIGGFLAAFWPPSLAPDFLALLGRATLETLAMATAGTTLAFVIAVPLAFAATRALSVSRLGPGPGRLRGGIVRRTARLLLMGLRAIPEIVWALLFVRAMGLGPAAGVLALAVTYGGMLGKVYAEILESVDNRPAQALLESGSSRIAALAYGLLPNAAQELASYTVYRWECAVRASVVMGFVGAGGLGQLMDQSMKMLNGGEACSILLVFLALVLLADALSNGLRRLLA